MMKARFLFFSLLMLPCARAAPPDVTALTPAGAERGKTVAVTAVGTFEKWPVDAWSSSAHIVVKAEKEKGKFAVSVANDAPLGPVWLRFFDGAGASQLKRFIVGGLPEIQETEPNDDAKTAPIVPLPNVVNGGLSKAGDVDCFRISLKKGQTLAASLEAHRTLRSPMDAVLQLLSNTGEVLEQNHDARGLDPELNFSAPADGEFVVRLFAFPSQPDSNIRHFGSAACVYRLTLTAGEFLDFATPLAVERNRESTLALSGWNLKGKEFKLGKADEFVGIAHPFPIARETHPCYDLDRADDKPLSPPFSATGRVRKAGEPSVTRIAGTAKRALAIRLESASLGLSLNPMLKIADAAGKQIHLAEPAEFGRDLETVFAPPSDGGYSIEVRDLFKTAGPRHLYRLRVTPADPDVELKLAADRFELTVGTPLDMSISVDPKNGFEGELVPFAEGLPEGVAVSVAPAPAKPDKKTMALRFTATKAGIGGPIRIGAAKKGEGGFRRTAVALLSEHEQTTSNIWLTVSPGKK